MGACGSSEDTNDTKPTTGKSDNPTKDKEETVTVTFNLNYTGATDTPPVAQTIKKGDKATEPTEPTRAKYKLTNWYTDAATTKTFAFTNPITKNITLYAGWQKTVYTVTFDSNGGTGTVPEQSIPKNGKATEPTTTDNPKRTGYTFNGWYTQQDGSGTAFAFTTTPITADTKLYAGWQKIITYTVTFDLNYTGAAAPTTATVEHGKNATEPNATDNPTRDGYTFNGWYTQQDGSGTAFAFGTTTITTDITLYAKWIQIDCREARKTLTHVVSLYNQGKADTPYLPQKLLGTFTGGAGEFLYLLSRPTAPPPGKDNQLPYIDPLSHLRPIQPAVVISTGGFEITPDYIDASFTDSVTPSDNTVRISCYSMKQVNDNLYFYYGKVKFLLGDKETEGFNKSMYAQTGIDKNDDSNKDALYGYMVSIQGDKLRALKIYPFVGGKYTRASDNKTVTFPKTEAQYAALTLEDLNIIATAPLTSELLFAGFNRPAGIYGIGN